MFFYAGSCRRFVVWPGSGSGPGPSAAAARCAAATYLVLALTLTLVLVLRFFNYRVVPDIPSLINSLDTTTGKKKSQSVSQSVLLNIGFHRFF